jgi:hypothetical protein
MKIRQGFVSNSSSASFVVIAYGDKESLTADKNGVFVVGKKGVTKFGWTVTRYTNIHDRINFAYIQTDFGKNKKHFRLLEKVLLANIVNAKRIIYSLTEDFYPKDQDQVWGYIDHQSSWSDGKNLEIFDSEDALTNFLFNEGSYIQGDHDNH